MIEDSSFRGARQREPGIQITFEDLKSSVWIPGSDLAVGPGMTEENHPLMRVISAPQALSLSSSRSKPRSRW
jgi:hypothetical protein